MYSQVAFFSEFTQFNEFEFDQHLEKDKSGKKFMISIKKHDQAEFNQTKTESNDFSLAGQDGKNDRSTLEQGHGKGQEKVVQPIQPKIWHIESYL